MNVKIVLLVAPTLIGACVRSPAPEITYDPAAFTPAVVTPPPARPVEIVTVPDPLPLPGQLKLLPGAPKARDNRPPQQRVTEAQAKATIEPRAEGYVNAIQVWPFTDGALYQLYTAPEQVSAITLQPGESIVAVSAGDTVRWIIGDTVSGSGESARAHVLVKPITDGLHTNLVIITDRRSYHLELTSTAETYMASVSWHYPKDALIALKSRNFEAEAAEARMIDAGLDLEALQFRYGIDGDTPPWRPVRVFDDGRKVYIQFPAGFDQGEAPPLFVIGGDGETQLVNYRVRGRYYILDRLFAVAELRLGSDPQQVVRITRIDAGGTS